jgi:hypothetical protein
VFDRCKRLHCLESRYETNLIVVVRSLDPPLVRLVRRRNKPDYPALRAVRDESANIRTSSSRPHARESVVDCEDAWQEAGQRRMAKYPLG